jgi:predicted permease
VTPSPPWLSRLILRLALPPADCACALADLDDEFEAREARDGPAAARRWYRSQVRHSVLPGLRSRLVGPRRRAASGASHQPVAYRRAGSFGIVVMACAHAWRHLAARPGPAVAVVCLLAFAVGLTVSMFTIVDSVVFRPLPFSEPDRLVTVSAGFTGTPPELRRAWQESGVFSAVEASLNTIVEFDTHVEFETPYGSNRVVGAKVTAGMFAMLGVRPVRGRLFAEGARDEILVTESLWRLAFGADPGSLGSVFRVGGAPAVLVGVVSDSFRFPESRTRFFQPLAQEDEAERPRAYARLADVPDTDALAVASAVSRRLGFTPEGRTVSMRKVGEMLTTGAPGMANYTRAATTLFAGVVLVFVVLSANAGSLLLTRLASRRRDAAVSAALGASRARLVFDAAVEHVLIGAVSAAAGIGVAVAAVELFQAYVPNELLQNTLNPVDLDPRALGLASAAGLVVVLVCGVLPALVGARADLVSSLRQTEGAGTSSRASRSASRILLVGQVALASTLLLSAVLLMRSLVEIANADRGVDVQNVMTSSVFFDAEEGGREALRAALEAARVAMAAVPGVTEVAVSQGRPAPATSSLRGTLLWTADTAGAEAVGLAVDLHAVDNDYFALYRIPLVSGRFFGPDDDPMDVIVGQRLATALWQEQDPVGRTFTSVVPSASGQAGSPKRYRVTGVARETTFPSLDGSEDRPELYQQFGLLGRGRADVSIRCAPECPPTDLLTAAAESAGLRLTSLRLLEDRYRSELEQPRMTASIGLFFALTAVAVTAIGLFSLLTAAVGQRRREFGIRTALGASRSAIHGLVLREALVIAALGLGLGAAVGWIAVRSFSALHYGVSASDPLSWTVVFVAIALATLAAAWRPARRAASVDPIRLLREE